MTFCEILHHVRKSFTLEQLATVVSYMACCVADRSLPFQSQSTCVRLSLNLVECLYQVGCVLHLMAAALSCNHQHFHYLSKTGDHCCCAAAVWVIVVL